LRASRTELNPLINISFAEEERWCVFFSCMFFFRDLLGEDCAIWILKIEIKEFPGHTPSFSASVSDDY